MPLMWIYIIFYVNVISIPEVTGFGINDISSLKSSFKILVITVIGSSMCLSLEVQKDIIKGVTGHFSMCILW